MGNRFVREEDYETVLCRCGAVATYRCQVTVGESSKFPAMRHFRWSTASHTGFVSCQNCLASQDETLFTQSGSWKEHFKFHFSYEDAKI